MLGFVVAHSNLHSTIHPQCDSVSEAVATLGASALLRSRSVSQRSADRFSEWTLGTEERWESLSVALKRETEPLQNAIAIE